MEQAAIYLWFAGIVLAVAGFGWLLIAAFRQKVLWGLGALLLLPLPFFVIYHWRKALKPLIVLGTGWAAVGAAVGLAAFAASIDLGPREKIVDGELHVTLTGWNRNTADYAVLRSKPDIVVLQMANPDVTDQTLEYLREMHRLRELDLNDTQVTDQGLRILNELPSLESLRLRNTKITDQGFQEFLGHKESLQQLDLRGTEVSAETVHHWRSAKSGRRVLR
jgi:hypothetical protein